MILLGSVGENTALEYSEKLVVPREMAQVVKGRIPLLTGVAEYSYAFFCLGQIRSPRWNIWRRGLPKTERIEAAPDHQIFCGPRS